VIQAYIVYIEGMNRCGTGRNAGKIQNGNALLFFLTTLCVLGISVQTPLTGVAHVVKDEDRVDCMATDAAKKNALGCMPRAIAVSRPSMIEVAISDAPLSASQHLLQRVDGFCPRYLHIVSMFFQYSLGNRMVVADRSASVITQILTSLLVRYALRIRKPCVTEKSFSR
jgi:hypothetical protein